MGLLKLVIKAEQNAENLDEEDRYLFYEYTTWRLGTWETVYSAYMNGLVREDVMLAWDGYYRLLIAGTPGYATFFKDTEPQWPPDFLNHVNEIINSQR